MSEATLPAILAATAERHPDRPSLSFYDGETMSYRALKEKVGHVAAFLNERGVSHGDRVAILGENGPNWGVAYFAITSLGAVAVPILADFHAAEVHHVLRHSEAMALFVSEKQCPKIDENGFENLKTRILLDDFTVLDSGPGRDGLRRLISEGEMELRKFKTRAMKLVGLLPDKVREDDVASIIYTSGTTGHTKGVVLTHKNVASNAAAAVKLVGVTPGDRLVSLLPLAHVYECTLGLVAVVMQGASVAYIRKPPAAAVLLPAFQAVKPTIVLSVPLIIEKMVRTRVWPQIQAKAATRWAYKVPSLRKAINRAAGKKLAAAFGGSLKLLCVGGAALAQDVESFLREADFPYSIGYGLTETSPLVAGTDTGRTKVLSTGPPLEGVEVRIDHPDPATGEGEILVRGPGVMKGYYKDPQMTAEVLSPDGWLRTGDLGCFDSDGYLFIKGRLKNVIIGPSGENIYPEIIESVINRSEVVQESLVFEREGKLVARVGLDCDKLDAFFVEKNFTEAQIREHIQGILEGIKNRVNETVATFSRLSRVIQQIEPFEKTPTQKIKRYLYVGDGPLALS